MADEPEEELTQAEQLGLLVGAAYGKALSERDQAVAHLTKVLAHFPATSFAHANNATEEAKAWLDEFQQAQTVGSPETPEQETAGP